MDKRIPNRSTDKDSAEGPRAGEAVSQPRRRAPAKDKPEAKPKPGFDKQTIALVYDFDGTLSPEADAGIRASCLRSASIRKRSGPSATGSPSSTGPTR